MKEDLELLCPICESRDEFEFLDLLETSNRGYSLIRCKKCDIVHTANTLIKYSEKLKPVIYSECEK